MRWWWCVCVVLLWRTDSNRESPTATSSKTSPTNISWATSSRLVSLWRGFKLPSTHFSSHSSTLTSWVNSGDSQTELLSQWPTVNFFFFPSIFMRPAQGPFRLKCHLLIMSSRLNPPMLKKNVLIMSVWTVGTLVMSARLPLCLESKRIVVLLLQQLLRFALKKMT